MVTNFWWFSNYSLNTPKFSFQMHNRFADFSNSSTTIMSLSLLKDNKKSILTLELLTAKLLTDIYYVTIYMSMCWIHLNKKNDATEVITASFTAQEKEFFH